jgi:hypothetical protein
MNMLEIMALFSMALSLPCRGRYFAICQATDADGWLEDTLSIVCLGRRLLIFR